MASDGAFSTATRARIHARAKGRCEVCGARIVNGGQIHHRKPRGMGGTSDSGKASCANGLWVHPRCHDRIESQRVRAIENGWLVPQTAVPEFVPVKLWDGLFLLSPDGSMRKVDDSI